MTPRTRSLLLLHGIVVIFGFTGILGKLISIDAEPLVFWRVTIGGLSTELVLACDAPLGAVVVEERAFGQGESVGLLPPIG